MTNEAEIKIVFTGPMGAGKTTAISVISEVKPLNTEVPNTDTKTHAKATTTVGLDFGQISLADGVHLRLYGTPGQERFSFMWPILAKGAIGVVLLLDNSSAAPLDDLLLYLRGLGLQISKTSLVVGVGRMETHPVPTVEDFYEVLESQGMAGSVLSVDVRERNDVLLLIDVLLSQAETFEAEK